MAASASALAAIPAGARRCERWLAGSDLEIHTGHRVWPWSPGTAILLAFASASMNYQVECPFCGEPGDVDVEVGGDDADDQVFVQDCEVCCHPWAVRVKVGRDGEVSVSVDRD
jgi:hypothetical protein